MRTQVSIDGIQEVLAALRSLPSELQSRGGTAIRAALRAGAEPIAAEMISNIKQIVATPNKDGRNVSSGLLAKSIKIRRIRMPSGKRGESYLVGPHRGRYENDERLQKVGAVLEFGSARRVPMPWSEPAFRTKRQESMQRIVEVARARLDTMLARWQRRQARAERRFRRVS